MDVSTAPLLVKRRGIKRQRIDGKEGIEDEGKKGEEDEIMKDEQNNDSKNYGKQSILCSVPEGPETSSPPNIRRPTSLNVFGQEDIKGKIKLILN
jgi:hypothetical protein